MDVPVLVAIDVPTVGDERRKNWAKVVTNVDESLSTGWAFEGDFIATGGIQDVPIGAVLMLYGEKGSRTNPQIEVRLLTVNGDSTVTQVASAKGRAWARTLRDDVARLLAESADQPIGEKPWGPELLQYSAESLEEELRRRENLSD